MLNKEIKGIISAMFTSNTPNGVTYHVIIKRFNKKNVQQVTEFKLNKPFHDLNIGDLIKLKYNLLTRKAHLLDVSNVQ